LGIKPATSLAVLGAPDSFAATLGGLPAGVRLTRRLGGHRDVVVIFATQRVELARRLPALLQAIAPGGMIWVAWPKRTSGFQTDLTENVIREVALPTGLVDVKVCAIDATWSGLKLVIRRILR